MVQSSNEVNVNITVNILRPSIRIKAFKLAIHMKRQALYSPKKCEKKYFKMSSVAVAVS